MNIRYFKTFIAVAESGGISKVSDSLYLTQPAITKQIQILEEEYNKKLFNRSHREIILTEEGKKLLGFAKRIVEVYDESISSLCRKGEDQKGTITLAADFTIGIYILPRFMKLFMDNFPNLHIEMALSEKDGVLKALESGRAHLGLVESSPADNSIFSRPFYRDQLTIVAGKKITPRKIASLKHLCEVPFIGLHKGSDIRAAYSSWFKKKEIEFPTKIELNNIEAVKSFLYLNMGFSILPLCTVEQDIRLGLLERLCVEEFSLLQTFYLCYVNKKKSSRIRRLFLDFFADYSVVRKEI
jgi:LysR family transcriptional regulator, transcriptional activator of the cysJI operon